MAGGCKVTSQTVMILIGLLFWGAAAASTYIGAYVFKSYGHFEQITTSKLVLIPAVISIFVGVIMFGAGIMGCCGACKKNRCLLATFFLILLVIFSFLIVAGVLGYIYKGKVESTIKDNLHDSIVKYGNDTSISNEIDYMQEEFTCCGITNYTDWDTTYYFTENHHLPDSCCNLKEKNSTGTCVATSKTLHKEGCYDHMQNLFKKNLGYIAGIATAFAIVLIVGMISTCVLFWQKREQVPYANLSGSGFTV